MKKILIVDDEVDILEFLKYNLEKYEYTVETALNGEAGLKKIKIFQPDLVILDIMMPKMNGVQVCEKIKSISEFKDTCVVFLSARNEEFTQLACYDAGGDDFISKPIQMKVLLKKINIIFKRLQKNNNSIINGVQIDHDKYEILVNGKTIQLPKKQFELLSLLFSKPNKVFSRDVIIDKVWGTGYYISSRNIDVQIRKIREKIGDSKILTVKGVGYKFHA